MIIGQFQWDTGSLNDNIRKLLKDKNMAYENTFNGDILLLIQHGTYKVHTLHATNGTAGITNDNTFIAYTL